MIRFNCKNCGQKFKVSDQKAGKKGKCPKCKQTIVIPPAAQEPAQESSIIKFRCPSCNQKIAVTADYAGKRVRCAKCKNPLRIPQVSGQAGPAAVQDQTEVLRAGHQQPPEEESWQDMSNLDAQLFAEGPPVEIPVEQSPDDYGTADSQPLEYSPDSFARPPGTEEQPGKSRKIIFIGGACVVGVLLLGIVVYFLFAGSGTDQSQARLPISQVKEFAEQYIGLLENSEIDKAIAFLSPGLQRDVKKEELEGLAKQLSKGDILELECRVTNFEEHPEGNQFYLWYNIHYENENQHIVVSILEIDEELRIDGIAIEEPFGGTISIGPRSFEELEEIAFAAVFEKVRSIFTKFFCGFMLVILMLALLQTIAMWIVYGKAGYPGWAAIVPFYNMWVLAEIGDKPGWLGLLMCFSGMIPYVGPIIGLVLSIMISIGVARAFSRGVGFGIGLSLVPFVFYPILAFSRD